MRARTRRLRRINRKLRELRREPYAVRAWFGRRSGYAYVEHDYPPGVMGVHAWHSVVNVRARALWAKYDPAALPPA